MLVTGQREHAARPGTDKAGGRDPVADKLRARANRERPGADHCGDFAKAMSHEDRQLRPLIPQNPVDTDRDTEIAS